MKRVRVVEVVGEVKGVSGACVASGAVASLEDATQRSEGPRRKAERS